MNHLNRRIIIVVQRYGVEVNGGAEQHARWLAEHLAAVADVSVMTTCALDYLTWDDHYPAGESELNGVRVCRFPVDAARDWKKNQRQTRLITTRKHTLFDEMQWVKDQGPYSSDLFAALRRAYKTTDLFIFYTFHYATTYFGLPLVSDKAFLVPTAHNDAFIHLPLFRPLFHLPRGIFYLTEPERVLVSRATRNDYIPATVTGVGIDIPFADAERFRRKFDIVDPFLLYVGRTDESKNVPELLEFFQRYHQSQPDSSLKLVLIGKANMPIPSHPAIVPLGFLAEEDKFDAIAAAELVVMPSLNESLSMITLEAWAAGKAVLVNEQCAVVKHLSQQSNGGLYYRTYDEFVASLQLLLDSEPLRRQLGRQGQRYVSANYHPDIVLKYYTDLLNAAGRDRPLQNEYRPV